jgi:hypothetical protein
MTRRGGFPRYSSARFSKSISASSSLACPYCRVYPKPCAKRIPTPTPRTSFGRTRIARKREAVRRAQARRTTRRLRRKPIRQNSSLARVKTTRIRTFRSILRYRDDKCDFLFIMDTLMVMIQAPFFVHISRSEKPVPPAGAEKQ